MREGAARKRNHVAPGLRSIRETEFRHVTIPTVLAPLFVQVLLTLAVMLGMMVFRGTPLMSGETRIESIAMREPNCPPVELLLGRLTPVEALIGLGVQAAWVALAYLLMRIIWRAGIRLYSAVGA